ncbi:AMPK1-CBM domain-containing protein [Fusarium sp. LHS14.1]|nr:AMPK1-CBM domain-containing protein [Fusarium sp. LHS14.1]
MGSFTFKWEHPADEVYVTGTFDDWTKSVKLEKTGDVFSKTVDLKDASSKIYYKFVVDGNWVINQSAANEPDTQGNVNNFLNPDQITKDTPAAAILNTVTPTSTTAAMASEQPIEVKPVEKVLDEKVAESKPVPALADEETLTENEKAHPIETPSDIPGGFPATPALELDKPVSIAPLANELEKPISVNPLPASEGAGNPITLAPGEKIPESITAQSTDKYVKLDKESYEKSDTIPGVETELPPVSANTIPESSLPIIGAQDVAINTVTPVSTTAALAAEVPLEPKPAVPEVVKESQEKADVAPEASAVAEGVEEKAKVEEELKEKVPEAPATSEGTAGQGTEKSEKAQDAGLAALAATAGGAVIAAGLTAKETIEEKAAPVVNNATEVITDAAAKNLPDAVKEKLPVAAQEALDAKAKEQIREEVSPEVPAEVKESLVEAVKSPEAAANTEAVQEKKEVEAELLKEIKPVTGTYDAVVEPTSEETKQVSPEVPAEVQESIIEAGKSPEAAANTEAVEEKKVVEAELLKEVAPVAPVEETKTEAVAPEVPAEVKESIVEAGKAPEAAASTEAVENKKEVEAELLKETEPVPAVEEAKPAADPAAVVAPVVQPEEAKPETKVEETKTEEAKPAVEPVTKPEEAKAEAKAEPQAETPAVGNGASAAENGSKATETKAAEPAANGSSAASTTTAQKKKHNRLSSIFSKIKHKLSDHK